MEEALIVVIGGVRGSGKTTVSGEMTAHGYAQWSFAAPLKQMAKIAFPQLTHEQLWGSSSAREESLGIELRGLDPRDGTPMRLGDMVDGEQAWIANDGVLYPKHLTARLILQTLGTDWGRRLHDEIWVEAALEHCAQTPVRWTIADQRFKNEVVVSRERGAITVRLLRKWYETRTELERRGVLVDGSIRYDSLSGDNADVHPSEVELFTIGDHLYDYVLDNRCELDQMPALVKKLCVEIENPQAHWIRARNFADEMKAKSKAVPQIAPMRIGL